MFFRPTLRQRTLLEGLPGPFCYLLVYCLSDNIFLTGLFLASQGFFLACRCFFPSGAFFATWRHPGAAARTRGVLNPILAISCRYGDPIFIAFGALRFQVLFYFQIVFKSLLYRLWSQYRFMGFQKPACRIQSIATTFFLQKPGCLLLWARFLAFFSGLESSLSDFRCPGDRLEN